MRDCEVRVFSSAETELARVLATGLQNIDLTYSYTAAAPRLREVRVQGAGPELLEESLSQKLRIARVIKTKFGFVALVDPVPPQRLI